MNIFFGLISVLIGIISFPVMLIVIKSNYKILDNRIMNLVSCFLFLTFPFVNLLNAILVLFFNNYEVSNVCGIYGLFSLIFFFLVPNEKEVKEDNVHITIEQ